MYVDPILEGNPSAGKPASKGLITLSAGQDTPILAVPPVFEDTGVEPLSRCAFTGLLLGELCQASPSLPPPRDLAALDDLARGSGCPEARARACLQTATYGDERASHGCGGVDGLLSLCWMVKRHT